MLISAYQRSWSDGGIFHLERSECMTSNPIEIIVKVRLEHCKGRILPVRDSHIHTPGHSLGHSNGHANGHSTNGHLNGHHSLATSLGQAFEQFRLPAIPDDNAEIRAVLRDFGRMLRSIRHIEDVLVLTNKRGLVFDFDQLTGITERAHFCRFKGTVDLILGEPLSEVDFRREFADAFHKPEDKTCAIIGETLGGSRFNRSVCAYTNQPVTPTHIAKLATDHLDQVLPDLMKRGAVRPDPFVRSLMSQASERGMTVALATASGRAVVEVFLKHFNLAGQYAVAVYADASHNWSTNEPGPSLHAEKRKPHPDHYALAATLAGHAPQDLVALEDSGTGACAGLLAGLDTVMRPTKSNGKQLVKLEETVRKLLTDPRHPAEERLRWAENLSHAQLHLVSSISRVRLGDGLQLPEIS